MAANGVLGNGTRVGYSASSPVSWTRVAQLLNVVIPGLEFDEVETTVHSTSGLRRFMPGLGDVSEMELELLADLENATHLALQTYQAARTTLYWRIEIPVNRAQTSFKPVEFAGFVKKWIPQPPIDDKQTIMCTVRFDDTAFSLLAVGSATIT